MPSTFIKIPDKRLDIGAGAAGWASGNQEWNGTSAAFIENAKSNIPSIIQKNVVPCIACNPIEISARFRVEVLA
jgi:hypothetical protein